MHKYIQFPGFSMNTHSGTLPILPWVHLHIWKIDRMPYYLLINRKGQIVDFGTTARPSNPQLVSRIEEAVKDSK